jgi:hypothetical protein
MASLAPAQPLKTAVTAAEQEEIIVRGQRSERYRIPPELRTLPAERSERWRKSYGRDFGCQRVGPRGCGTPVVPIFTITGDGKVRIGQKKDPAD